MVVIGDVEVLLFGKDKNLTKRVYVLYDGTHYNLIKSGQKRVFDPKDEQAYQGCLELAKECKKNHEDIDTTLFSLVCYECDRKLAGQFDAVEHAQ